MKGFRGTIVFGLVVGAIAALALYELKKSKTEEEGQTAKNHLFKDLVPESVEAFSLKNNKGAVVELKKLKPTAQEDLNADPNAPSDLRWYVSAPVKDLADAAAVDSTLRTLFAMNVEALEPGEGEKLDPNQFGLQDPIAEIDFQTGATSPDSKNTAPSASYKVRVGRVRTYDGGFYVQKDGSSEILVGDASWDSLVSKTTQDFRNREILFPEKDLVRVKISSRLPTAQSDTELVLKDGQWTAPKKADVKIDAAKVRDLFAEFQQLRATGFLPDLKGIAKPDVTWEFDFGSEKVLVKGAARKGDEALLLGSNAESSDLLKVPKSKLIALAKPLSAFVEKPKEEPKKENPEKEVPKEDGHDHAH